METKELQDFISFFTRNKTLSYAQQRKRDFLLTRDYSKLIELIQELPEAPTDVENSGNENIGNTPNGQANQEEKQPMLIVEKSNGQRKITMDEVENLERTMTIDQFHWKD